MDIFLYFYEPLTAGLDEPEDALDSALVGIGEVTGAGTGTRGSNIDLRIDDDSYGGVNAVKLIRSALAEFALPISSKIKIDGKEWNFG